jgi:hypothetical protein
MHVSRAKWNVLRTAVVASAVILLMAQGNYVEGSCGANSITLTSPNSGVLGRGRSVTVTWTTTGIVGPSIRIDLYIKGTLYQNIATGVPASNHSYNWTVPSGQQASSGYSIFLSDANGHSDQSHGYLIIR